MKYEHSREYLCHHGILGQKWGHKNGPPYPLDSSDHSTSEKKAGWRKSLNKSDLKNQNDDSKEEKKKTGLSDKQKKALKVGAAAAATAIAAYGTYRLYKSGKFDKVIDRGKEVCNSVLNEYKSPYKRLKNPESIAETVKKANPYMGTVDGKNSCVACALAAFMRQNGFDVVSKGTGGEKQITGGVVEECFKGSNPLEGNASVFGQSRDKAVSMLKSRFGNNASGICAVDLKKPNGETSGHCFNWSIKEGVVSFFDSSAGLDDSKTSKYFNIIDTAGQLCLARLDGLEIDFDALSKYIK